VRHVETVEQVRQLVMAAVQLSHDIKVELA